MVFRALTSDGLTCHELVALRGRHRKTHLPCLQSNQAGTHFNEKQSSTMTNNRPNGVETLERRKSEHRALALLRFLHRETANTSNECIIGDLFEMIGLSCSRQEVRDGLERLERLELVQISKRDHLLVVRLLARGDEVATGRVTAEGIPRPWVDCPY